MKAILSMIICWLYGITNLIAIDTLEIKIVNIEGEPVANVLVQELDGLENIGQISNEHGIVSIELSQNKVGFSISHICYPTQQIELSNLSKTVVINDYDFWFENSGSSSLLLGVYKDSYDLYKYSGTYAGDQKISGIIKIKSKVGIQERFILDVPDLPDMVLKLNRDSKIGYISNLPLVIANNPLAKLELKSSIRYCE